MQKLTLSKALGSTLDAPVNGIQLNRGDTIIASGLAGVEVAALHVLVGTAFQAAKDDTGAAIELTATKNSLTILGSGTYKIVVGTTAGAVVISFNTK